MASVADLVADARQSYRNPTEEAIFGTDDAGEIASALQAVVASTVGTVDEGIFYLIGVGVVAAVRLKSGQAVVVKVHRYNVSLQRLTSVHAVQAHLAAQGMPAPRPLGGPTPVGRGIAVVEEYLPASGAAGREPAVRRSMARGLQSFIATASAMQPMPDVGERDQVRPKDSLYGEPHDVRFDFAGTSAGAEWIDSLAAAALARLECDLPLSVGHLDWRVENLGFHGHDISAIYDWDSVWLAPEPVAVGQAAAAFSTDWRVGPSTFPTVEDMAAFVGDYEDARGRPFTSTERAVLDAANLYLLTYGARCEHSDHTRFELTAPKPFADLLRARDSTPLG